MQGNADLGNPSYLGPCPPQGSGEHHFVFTVYALKSAKPDIEAGASGFYNAIFAVRDGSVVHVHRKVNLATYGTGCRS